MSCGTLDDCHPSDSRIGHHEHRNARPSRVISDLVHTQLVFPPDLQRSLGSGQLNGVSTPWLQSGSVVRASLLVAVGLCRECPMVRRWPRSAVLRQTFLPLPLLTVPSMTREADTSVRGAAAPGVDFPIARLAGCWYVRGRPDDPAAIVTQLVTQRLNKDKGRWLAPGPDR
jgi:hypothetical protein